MIGIIAALDKEVQAITAFMKERKHLVVSGVEMEEGILNGKCLVVIKSGVGKGNACISTTILLENYPIDCIINIGTAGGLIRTQRILDAVVSDRIVQYDVDTSPVDGKEGIGLYFEADKKLADLCVQVLENMQVVNHRGLIASGDQFIAKESQIDFLKTNFSEAICAEMEAGGIAQVCSHYHIPFVVLRSLSDIVHNEGSHMDFLTFVDHASKRSAQFMEELTKVIA